MLFFFIATVIGGMGSLVGAVVGGYSVGIVSVVLSAIVPDELRGFRDAADSVYYGLCGDGPAGGAAAGPAPADVGDGPLTYGLQLLGIRDGSPNTGRGVRVAVLDTGIDVDHPDFQNRFANGDRLADFTNSGGPADDVGHGTHCAGTVGGPLQSIGGIAEAAQIFATTIAGRGWLRIARAIAERDA